MSQDQIKLNSWDILIRKKKLIYVIKFKYKFCYNLNLITQLPTILAQIKFWNFIKPKYKWVGIMVFSMTLMPRVSWEGHANDLKQIGVRSITSVHIHENVRGTMEVGPT